LNVRDIRFLLKLKNLIIVIATPYSRKFKMASSQEAAKKNGRRGSIACIVCATPLINNQNPEKASSGLIGKPIYFYQCETCSCLFAPEAASLAQSLYAQRESNNYTPNKSAWMIALQRALYGRHYGKLARKYGVTSIVDYGCGSGIIANALAGRTLSIFAIDVQQERPKTLAPEVTYFSTKEASAFDGSGRTLFILRHVLEHFDHPIQQLEKIATLAKRGDIFVVETPSANSAFRLLMKAEWPGYFPPYHVTIPTLATLHYISDGVGLVCREVCRREPPILGSYFARNSSVAANMHRVAGLLCYPVQIAVSKLSGMSEAVEVVLEKP
jgi:Methyltransferase domain